MVSEVAGRVPDLPGIFPGTYRDASRTHPGYA
jgi:hypothetical protein